MVDDPRSPDASGHTAETSLLATRELLRLSKEGDPRALDQLMSRYLPRLERWATGRLPLYARSLFDTADLVQDTLMRVLMGLDRVEVRGPGGFQAYVRQAVLNRIREEVTWARRRPGPGDVPETLPSRAPSPLEQVIGADLLERYERGLALLDEGDRELLHLRIELDYDYEAIAEMTGRPSRDAARMAVQRALSRLADKMGHER
ncbi:MAG: RNA polymerase sigma factor [Candidatus Eiseniibacteriota bacterium]